MSRPKPVVRHAMHVKKGDTVKVISGKNKGEIGEIDQIFPKTSQVIIKGVNMQTKHQKPKGEGESGQILVREAPIHSSNVMLYSTKEQTVSRVSYVVKDGKKQRVLKKTGEVLDN
jgi:large subunit ribosomal protein L24